MRARGRCSVLEPWICAALVVPGSWAGDALCPVILRLIVNGAHHYKTTESRAPGERLSIWGRNRLSH